MIDVHALQVFFAAARSGSFTAAARSLNLSQPAVSMQIKNLQAYLGVELFERDGRHMRLTRAGEALLPLAERMLDLASHTEEKVREMSSQIAGRIRISCAAYSGCYVLPHLIARFQRMYPDVDFLIDSASNSETHIRLMDGLSDFGLVNTLEPCEGISCRQLFSERIVLIAQAGHPWLGRGAISPHELVTERFICQHPDSACRQKVMGAMERYGISFSQFNVRMEISSPEAIISAVEHGLGVSFVPLVAVAPHIPLGRVGIIEVKDMELSAQVHIAFAGEHGLNLIQSKFKAYLEHPHTQAMLMQMAEGRIG